MSHSRRWASSTATAVTAAVGPPSRLAPLWAAPGWAARTRATAASLTSATVTMAPSPTRWSDQAGTHLADAAHDDPAAGQVLGRVERGPHRLHGPPQPIGGGGRWVAGTAQGARDPGDVRSLGEDDVHVRLGGPHVLGGDVAPAQAVQEPPVGPEQRLGLVGGRVAHDHGLAAAQVQARHRRLVGHAPGQAQHVLHGLVLGAVGVETGPPERRAEHRRVDGDDGPQTDRRVVADHNLLKFVAETVEELHGTSSLRPRRRSGLSRGN